MAIKDELFQELFKPQKRPTITSKKYSHFRVHEEPETINKNLGQTKDELRTNLGENIGQSGDKLSTNLRQLHKLDTETSDKLRSQPRTQCKTNLGQTKDELRTNYSFSSFVGLQREILIFVYESCKASREKITNPISIEHLAMCCGTTRLSAQKTIQRLEGKQVLARAQFKNGRGGWTRYGIVESMFQEILQHETQDKLKTNLGQMWDKLRTEPQTQPRTSSSCSSSNNTNTTTTEKLPDDWGDIDLTELHKRNIRFTREHLVQVYSHIKHYSAFDFQESLEALIYDLDNKHLNITKNGVGLLISIFKMGGLYTSHHYISPERKLILEMAERSKQKREELEEAQFWAWLEGCDRDKITTQLPYHLLADYKANGKDSLVWIKENIWLKEKK